MTSLNGTPIIRRLFVVFLRLLALGFNRKVLLCALVLGVAFFSGAAEAADTFGVVDSQKLLFQHPRSEAIYKELLDKNREKITETENLIAKEPDPMKQVQIYEDQQREFIKEQQILMTPLLKDCEEIIRVVAQKKKITVVMEKDAAYLGGVDLTEEVIEILRKTKAGSNP